MRHKPNIYRIVGDAIRKERTRLGFSQEELSERADLTRNYLGMIERAESQITLETLGKVAKALRVRMAQLMGKL